VSSDVNDFFKSKRAWSKYKDLILSYYLEPYMQKVATLGSPILIVDCFAGRGKFTDGEDGSPLIIGKAIRRVQSSGKVARAIFIESDSNNYRHLEQNLAEIDMSSNARCGDFRSHIEEISEAAKTHSVFLYVDPIRPGDLNFTDLAVVYEQLRSGRSVETLINFLSTGFVRRAQGLRTRAWDGEHFAGNNSEVKACDAIAGGQYWQQIVFDDSLQQRQKIDAVADGYGNALHKWFQWVLSYPVRENYQDKQPKYHLIFGSRHTDAVDIMNRAMVKARREFVGAIFTEDVLFDMTPDEEIVDDNRVRKVIMKVMNCHDNLQWRELRAHASIEDPCMYTDSELNRSIKGLIRSGQLKSDCSGNKIENDAVIWLSKK